jgi:hypothetical protein
MSWRDGQNAAKWIPVISTAEIMRDIPKGLSSRQCYQESRFNPLARNPTSGAIGLFQLLAQYFPGAGVDPVKDIGTATAYLASLAKRFKGDWQLGLAAYDWGPGSVDKWQKSGAPFESMPKETRDYVSQIVADVPVPGVLCKIQSPQSQVSGLQVEKPSVAASSVPPLPKSLWQSVTGIFRTPSPQKLPAPLPPSASQASLTSLPTVNKGISMSTPNPFVAAAAPSLIAILQALQSFLTNLGTDPAQVAVKFPGALQVFLGTVEMQLPAVAGAELGAVQTEANAKITALIAKLQAPTA